MADNVSFKVYLNDPSLAEGAEVRRFVVDKDVSTSLIYIKEKLISVFPVLAERVFSVSWTDEDGDVITIDSDEELILALTELPGPVYKLTAIVKGAKQQEPEQMQEDQTEASNTVHPGVTCDGCEKGIVGFRYKCVVCDDYDLCGICEAAGKHPGHNMMRITNPDVIWPQRLFKRINKMQERASDRSRCRQERKEDGETAGSGTAGAPPPPPHFFGFGRGRGRGRFPGCGRGGMGGMGPMGPMGPMGGMGGGWQGMNMNMGGPGGHGGQHGAWGAAWAGPAFEAMMKGWMGEPGAAGASAASGAAGAAGAAAHEQAHQEAQATAEAAHAFAHSAAQSAAQDAHFAQTAAAQAAQAAQETLAAAGIPPSKSQEYLQRVGDFVAAALDPLGIDVQVDVETPGGQRTTASASASAGPTSATTTSTTTTQEKKNDEAMDTEEEAKNKESSASTSDDDEEWTEVVAEKPAEAEVREIPIMVQELVYPTLPTGEDTSPSMDTAPSTAAPADTAAPTLTASAATTAATPAQTSHADPKIQVALQAMMNMGFSNDGNWLANLLEAKDGDIGKVLDILQPVRR